MRARGILIAGAMALGLLGCEEDVEEAPAPLRTVRTTVAASGDGDSTRTFSGVARAGEKSRLSFRVAGRVSRVDVNVGDEVSANQVIATLDDADFRLQIQQARASSANASAQLRSAEANYARTRALYENENASRAQLDSARAAAESARAQLASMNQNTRLLRRQLEYTTLRAPAAGTIVSVPIRASENVGAGTVVAEMQIGDQLEVEVSVPESVIARISRGDSATISFDALDGRELPGTVFEVGVSSVGGGATFPVTVRLDESDDDVRAGMAADVKFTFESEAETAGIRLPSVAVAEDETGRYVYVVTREDDETGTVHRRAVATGSLSSAGIEVTEGLEAGEVVVIRGVARIQDGLRVRLPADAAPLAEAAGEGEGPAQGTDEAAPAGEDAEDEPAEEATEAE